MTKAEVTDILSKLGVRLGFRVGAEVQASDSAWVDVVWFDSRFDFGPVSQADQWIKARTWRQPVIPVVGFEIEASAGAKQVKGSVANLANLGATMGVLVLCEENVKAVRSRAQVHRNESEAAIWKFLLERATQWVSESRPAGVRVVILTEPELKAWAASKT